MTLDRSARLGVDQVRVGADYESARGDERHRVAELRRTRRVGLGESLALVFENRETIRAVLEEALRTERIDDPGVVADETAAFNAVMPGPGELAATLFLEVADPADLGAAALRHHGVERAVFLDVEGRRVHGVPESVSPPGERAPAHYLRFRFEPEQVNAIRNGAAVAAGTDHPDFAITVHLDEDQRQALAADL